MSGHRRASRRALQAQLTLLRQHFLYPSGITDQPSADKPEEIKAELRVLEIELPHLIVGDHQHLSRFGALDGRVPVRARRQEAHLAEDLAGPELDSELRHDELSFFRQEHFVGKVAFAKKNIALSEASPVHERLQPVHGQVAGGGGTDLLDQLQHLKEAERVERKQEGVQEDRWKGARENPRAQKKQGARDARNAQRDNGLHRRRCDVEHSANSRADVRGCDEAHEKWRTKVGFEPHESLHSSWPLTRVSTRCGFLVELHSPLQSQIRSEEGLSPAGGRHEAALARLPATGLHWSTAWTI